MKIDVFRSYLQSQAVFPEKAREPQLAITISREVGAGGRTIGELVGQRLADGPRIEAMVAVKDVDDPFQGAAVYTETDGKVTRINEPKADGVPSLGQDRIARWPHDLGIELGKLGS